MINDLQKYAERDMSLFNLIVSVWQHNLSLKNTIGIGFTKSVFVYENGICYLNASKKEIIEITERILELIKAKDPSFRVWYEEAKILNKKADELLIKYQENDFDLNIDSYNNALKIFIDNFGYCTIFPYWVLYAINLALERGEKKESFGDVLSMYEELKSETRYPQLAKEVIGKYFNKASNILNISEKLILCIHPAELGQIISGTKNISLEELEKRNKWCAVTMANIPFEVNFVYDRNIFPELSIDKIDQDILEFKGNIAFKVFVRGRVKIINTIDDMKKFEEGDILVSIQSNPSLMPIITKCSAIITDEGGIMCHASIVSRELKKPCIIGTNIATKILKDGDLVEVDANNGVVRIIK